LIAGLNCVRPEMVVLPRREWFRARLERFCNPA
jgi:hypothetical protein